MRAPAIVALALFAPACALDQDKRIATATSEGIMVAESRAAAPPAAERLLVRSASIHVEVEELGPAVAAVQALAERDGGFVEHTSESEKEARLRIRVPEPHLLATLDAIEALGDEESREVRARDVTEQAMDLESRLATARALRDRLRALLDRAERVKDVVDIERELARVQNQIERDETRLERLREQVALSAVDVRLTAAESRVYGPLGLVWVGTVWLVKKLFVIYP